MSSAQKDFYRILGVIDSAESAVIRAAYKALIMIYHPDRLIGNKDKAMKMSKDINEAYAVLIDPDKRKKYDAQRLSQSGKITYQPENFSNTSNSSNALNELKRTLKESEAILELLNEPGKAFNQFRELHEFKSLLTEAEAILKLLNEPD